MFTSRAEFRTLLRQDNADLRLTEKSYRIGLASQERMNKVIEKKEGTAKIRQTLKDFSIEPEESKAFLESKGTAGLLQKQKALQVLLRPSVGLHEMIKGLPRLGEKLQGYSSDTIEQAEIQAKYEVYIEKEKELVQKMGQLEELAIPDNFNYDRISSLSTEALQKFKKIKPATLGQASRISGVNPSDVQILMVYMGR